MAELTSLWFAGLGTGSGLPLAQAGGGDDGAMLGGTVVLMLLLLFGSVPVGWLWAHLFRRRAGGVAILEQPTGWRVRLPRAWPIIRGMLTTGGLAFVETLIVGFATNGRPGHWVVVATTVVAYGGGLVVYGWQWGVVHSGVDDLVFDRAARTVQLPLTFGRTLSVAVPVADIQAVRVETVEEHGRKGGVSYTYRPTLVIRGALGSQVLADWSDETKAKAFAAWLAEELGVREWVRV